MSETTGISWTDATFNPWWGCQKVSPACDHCYAERDANRFAPGKVLWGASAERRTFGDKHWKAPLTWARAGYAQCFNDRCLWRGAPPKGWVRTGGYCPKCGDGLLRARRRVFCASMGDWLDLDAPIVEFVRLLDTIRLTPELDWLLLSKRIGNWRKRLEAAIASMSVTPAGFAFLIDWTQDWLDGDAPANVWIGATVIDQAEADRDIPKLLGVPARVRFLSIEPMLGEIDLHVPWGGIRTNVLQGWSDPAHGIHWVIAGGESGPHARPTPVSWLRDVVAQCKVASVPVHVKQLGAQPRGWCAGRVHMPPADDAECEDDFCDFYEAHEQGSACPGRCGAMVDKAGRDVAEWPADLRVQEFPA